LLKTKDPEKENEDQMKENECLSNGNQSDNK
jgi:hypothetical protein